MKKDVHSPKKDKTVVEVLMNKVRYTSLKARMSYKSKISNDDYISLGFYGARLFITL